MVAIQAKINLLPRVRWLGYLTLSLFISLDFAYRIDINTAAIPIPAPELLKVNLLALTAPKPESFKQAIRPEPVIVPPTPVNTKKIFA